MNTPHRHTVLLVDDHPLLRQGLRQLLELEDDFLVIGEAGNGEEALALLPGIAPELIILDNNMPVMNGIETLKRLRQAGFTGKILLYTVSDLEQDVRGALRFGADGYLLKDVKPEIIIQQIRHVLAGSLEVSPSLTAVLAQSLRTPAPQSIVDLTPREKDVLRMIAEGNSNKMVGNKLGISEGTVKTHVKSLLHKIGARSRVDAAVWATENLK
ncbi:MAG: transcriptional regulator NarL [Moraxellaceae bacterium]|jgi:two-component system nitrate/nitrite response regulator NarL|nr:transcriptional regulator NarL [Moraxellaceae bacterium]